MPKFNLIFIKNLLFIFLIIFSCNTFSASFDCAKATTPIEKLICSNNSLSTKDEALNKTYKTALSKTNNQKELTKRQLNWLKNTRNQCNTVECLEYVYQERIDNLEREEVIQNKFDAIVWDDNRTNVWWGFWIKEKEIVKKVNQQELVKLTTVRQVVEYKDGVGSEQSETTYDMSKNMFIFCADKLPVIIGCEKEQQKCQAGYLPFMVGTNEVQLIAFFNYACPYYKADTKESGDPAVNFEILEGHEKPIILNNLSDIFDYYKKLK
jgi:uncharacterized protein